MDKGTPEEMSAEPLFSNEERRRIVRNFIEAYIRGTVKIHYPTKKEVKKGVPNPEEAAKKMETSLFELMTWASGAGEPPASFTVEKSIHWLFGYLVALRQQDRLDGQFLEQLELQAQLKAVANRVEGIEQASLKLTSYMESLSPTFEKLKGYEPLFDRLNTFLDTKEKEEEDREKWK